ncbi:MAG: hypothetical protein GY857_01140 [Desulfobacula sp.]|nr:hypothetical protein [Desulfobacula sp.]
MMMPRNKYNIQTNDSFLENSKNELLLALYEKNYHKAHGVFNNILQHIKPILSLDENSEKLLNQIHLIIKKFSPKIPENIWIQFKKKDKFLNNYIISSMKKSTRTITHMNFQSWEEGLGLNQTQKNLLFQTAMTFQLTVGCSNFCRRCNEWALPKVRSHFSFKAIKKILQFMKEQNNDEISLYGASDPLDWMDKRNCRKEKYGLDEKGKNISNIIDYLHKLPLQYNILTKAPKGKECLLKSLVKSNANLAVSITSKNKTRIAAIEKNLELPIGKQHDLDELLIPAGLDEDFISIKPSITDGYGTEITPDGTFIIIPTFTTALHPLGHKKIPITCKTNFFPIKIIGRDALLVDYFKPLKGYNLNRKVEYLDYLLDVQIESIILDNGKESLTPPGMRSLKEYLSIFDEKPRLQREKMTRTVFKRLKKQFLFNTNFKDLATQTRELYLKKIRLHLDLCKKDNCLAAKLLAVSFFLKSILLYVKKNQTKTSIMKYLLKGDIEYSDNTIFDTIHNRTPQYNLNSADITSFEIFQYYIFQLLENPDNEIILKFIKTYPSKYDPVIDIFIQDQ